MCHQRACPKIMTEEGSRNNRHGNRYKLELGRKKNENVNNARFFPLDRLFMVESEPPWPEVQQAADTKETQPPSGLRREI